MLPGRTKSALYISIHANLVLLETLRQEKVSYLSLAANYIYVYMRLFLLKLRKCVISKNLGKTLLPNVDRSSAAIILFCSKNYYSDLSRYLGIFKHWFSERENICLSGPRARLHKTFVTTTGIRRCTRNLSQLHEIT